MKVYLNPESYIQDKIFTTLEKLVYTPLTRQYKVIPNTKAHISDFYTDIGLAYSDKREAPSFTETLAIALQNEMLEECKCFVTGSLYINFIFSIDLLCKFCEARAAHGYKHIRTQSFFLDFGGMNIAKPMHVGHIRGILVGETLKRLYQFLGHKVISDIHFGDYGMHIGITLMGIKEKYPSVFDTSEKFTLRNCSGASTLSIEEIATIYSETSRTSRRYADADKAALSYADEVVLCHQNKSNKIINELIADIRDISVAHINEINQILGVAFDLFMGESDVLEDIPAMLNQAINDGICDQVGQAILIDSLVIRKNNGCYLYTTTDLATIQYRIKHYPSYQNYIYIHDQRQEKHFNDLFDVAHKMRLYDKNKCTMHFIGLGTVNDHQGKPFKTRSGSFLSLKSWIESAMTQDKEQNKVLLNNIKLDILFRKMNSHYGFASDRILNNKRNIASYITYTIVRLESIKSQQKQVRDTTYALNDLRHVLLKLTYLDGVLQCCFDEKEIHHLVRYTYDLCVCFNSLYDKLHISSHYNSYMELLCSHTLTILRKNAWILNIDIPDYM